MGDLTANFSMDEFLVSETAERHGISNEPTAKHRTNIATYTAPVLQRIRDRVARAVFITSGYRNPQVNRLVGGVENSAHAQGLAADIRAAGLTAKQLATIIAGDARIMADIDQLILETGRGVVHVSADPRRRRQVLTQAGGPGSPVTVGIS